MTTLRRMTMKLSEKLKTIYTQGDTFTVLQLLNEMIKTVESYEQETQSDLYMHNIRFVLTGDGLDSTICIYTNSSDELNTMDKIRHVLGNEDFRLVTTGSLDGDPVFECEYDGDIQFISSARIIATFDDDLGTITDTVIKVN